MKINQIIPKANQSQNDSEMILRTIDDTDLENLSGGVTAAYIKFDGVDGESKESSDIVNVPVTIKHGI